LAQGDLTDYQPSLVVLERLLANFGKPYAEAIEAEGVDHKKLSAECFNRVWELLAKVIDADENKMLMDDLSRLVWP
jgi:hypothetical protein